MATDVETIKAILDEWVTAINTGRAHTVARLVSPDVVFSHPPSTAFVGKDVVAQLYREAFRAYDVHDYLQFEDIRILGGTSATARVTEQLTITPKDGGDVAVYTERDAMLFRRQADGTWKLVSRSLASPSRWLFPASRRQPGPPPVLPRA
jgi:uncharacterized protein (TIGR02246 family)